MAAFVRTRIDDNFIDLPRGDLRLYALANGGESEAGRKARNRLLGAPDFIVEGTSDTNTAALSAGAAQSFLINLSTAGVSFPAGYDRDIDVIVRSRDETDRNFQHIRQTVRGGTDPTLINGVRNMRPDYVGGRCTFANTGTDIVAADAWGGFAVTLDNTAAGRFAAAIPKARRVLAFLQLAVIGTGAGTDALVASLNAINLATGVIEIGIRAADDGANIAPADTMQLHASFDLLPVENPELAIVTTTTPDQVIVGAVGQASENVRWYAEIYVGDLYPNNLATASE